MEQFRQIGEALGSLKALMVLEDDIRINKCQCSLLLDVFSLAFAIIAEQIRLNLKLEEKNTKWKVLEQPLRELHRIFKEGEIYVRHCLDCKDWWGKAISFHQNKDCVEFHIHNLLTHFPVVVEAIETAGEISGLDQEEMQRRRVVLTRKYDKEWNDPKLFQLRFGKEYLIPRDISSRFEGAWREDRWLLVEAIKEKKSTATLSKNELRLADLLLQKVNGAAEPCNGKLFPSSILLGAADYQVRRRLRGGSQCKEIQWLGESFALRQFFGEIEPLNSEICTLLSLSHPNILQHLCGFYDEEKSECLLVMELMNRDLSCYMRENCGARRQILFSLPVVVDLMLQIARGMEFLHSQKIYHGDLNPSNIFLKPRSSTEGYFHVKISGFGLTSVKSHVSRNSPPSPTSANPCIWHAPEVLAQQERHGSDCAVKYTEKADVYSFGMICFELLTGKTPFEDGHLQGDKMSKNIRAGERPLFPHPSPKYLVNLNKKCWLTEREQRPSFSSICRVLRYIKKFLVMNPDNGHADMQSPTLDYCDLEAGFLKKFSEDVNSNPPLVSQIPFQLFAYKLAEKEKIRFNSKVKNWEAASEVTSIITDVTVLEDSPVLSSDTRSVNSETLTKKFPSDVRSARSEAQDKKVALIKKLPPAKVKKSSGLPNPKYRDHHR